MSIPSKTIVHLRSTCRRFYRPTGDDSTRKWETPEIAQAVLSLSLFPSSLYFLLCMKTSRDNSYDVVIQEEMEFQDLFVISRRVDKLYYLCAPWRDQRWSMINIFAAALKADYFRDISWSVSPGIRSRVKGILLSKRHADHAL